MSSKGPRFRRNGKLQACEPCRRHKIKCDHEMPVCGRCRRRRLDTSCHYHPAPMTRSPSSPVSWKSERVSQTPQYPNASIASILNQAEPPLSSQESTLLSDPDTVPGFLGSTSFSEVWKGSGHAADNEWLGSLMNFRRTLRTHRTYRHSRERIQSGATVLHLLSQAQGIRKIIREYYKVSPTVVCPETIMERCLDSITATLQEVKTDEERFQLAERIFKQTFIPLTVDENTTPENMHLTCTGPKLRFEIIGVVLVCYVMGCLATDHEKFTDAEEKLLLDLTHASNLCVSFCDRAENLNDLLLWLIHTNVILLTFQYGDASHVAWRRVGDLSSSIYALGLHQEPSPQQPKLPFFLQELRRIVFCNAYSTDKALATFFGRPPRISRRYCTVAPPHDLTDEQIIAPSDVRNLALSKLDADGWNTDGRLSRATWGRIKFRINIIREETLELSLGVPRSDAEQRRKAEIVLKRSRETYLSIPSWARYNESVWTSRLDPNKCFTLLYYFLHTTYSEFLMLRVLARHQGTPTDAQALYECSLKLLSGVLNITKYRDRIGAMSKDFSWVATFYGLPPSALLAIELLRQQQSAQAQVNMPRAEIIRKISVFISSLEWVAKPADGNYDLCQGAKQLLDSILNAILDNSPTASEQAPQPAPADPVLWLDDMFSGGWMTSGNFVDSLGVENFESTQPWEPVANWPFEF